MREAGPVQKAIASVEDDKARLDASHLRAVMSIPAGRAVCWRVIDEVAGSFAPSHSGEATHETAHREGQRSVGLHLVRATQDAAPDLYVLMLQEALDARRTAEARYSAAVDAATKEDNDA